MNLEKRISINKNLSIIGKFFNSNTEITPVDKNVNYIFVCDNSGSMYSEMSELRKTLKAEYRKLKTGDTLTIAHFSSFNDYRYFVKAQLITHKFMFDKIDTLVDKYLVDSGLTCYTQVLEEAKNVIEDIQTISASDNFSFCFLSDGFPNDKSNINEIINALENIKASINSSYIIGYGRYYNKPVLAKMAETLGSTLIHNEEIIDFNKTFESFVSQKPEGKNWKIQLANDNIHFYINNKKEVVRIKGNSNNEVYIPETKTGTWIYEISNEGNINTDTDNVDTILYAVALVLCQSLQTQSALEVLSHIGDKFFVDRLNSAFTTSQYGLVETLLADAIKGNNRFVFGKVVNCLPNPDAFSLLDLIMILETDDTVLFYPNDPSFNYKRKGRKTETKDTQLEFTENKNDGYEISNLTLHKSRPNISFLIKKEGKVQLDPQDSEGYKLREKINNNLRKEGKETIPNQFPTHVFRNYNIVSDGDLNMNILPLSISETTYNALKNVGVIGVNERYGKNKIFQIPLQSLPIVSRKWGKDAYSSKEFAERIVEIQKYKVEQTVLNYFIKTLQPSVPKVNEFIEKYGEEGMNFLAERNITPNGFSPKVAVLPGSDFYLSKEFEITLKSFSSISVPKYLEKVEKINAWTVSQKGKEPSFTIVESLIDKYYKAALQITTSKPVAEQLELIKKLRDERRNEMRILEKELNTDKLIFLLTNSDFNDTTERGNIEVPLNEGYTAKIEFTENTIYV